MFQVWAVKWCEQWDVAVVLVWGHGNHGDLDRICPGEHSSFSFTHVGVWGSWALQYCTCLHSGSLHAQYSRFQFVFTDSTSAVIIVYMEKSWSLLNSTRTELLNIGIPKMGADSRNELPYTDFWNCLCSQLSSCWVGHQFIIVWRYWLKVNRLCSLLKNILVDLSSGCVYTPPPPPPPPIYIYKIYNISCEIIIVRSVGPWLKQEQR